jgi:hypothetical protein
VNEKVSLKTSINICLPVSNGRPLSWCPYYVHHSVLRPTDLILKLGFLTSFDLLNGDGQHPDVIDFSEGTPCAEEGLTADR